VSVRIKKLTLMMTAALMAAVIVFATGPRAPLRTAPAPARSDAPTVRGAFHIHTTRSDGALGKREVAAAAARVGLQFAVFTDHGTGQSPPDPPEYIDGVLCVDGVEISSNDGHYIAIDMPAAPYPLGGDADTVAEDVARLGGFGVAAHPASPRAELAWSDLDVPIDGFEWLNADSEWRDEGRLRLARGLLDYVWRPAGALAALMDRPVEALRGWDELTGTRPVVGLAGHDAHGGLGAETGGQSGRRIHLPSYEASFRTFSVHAALSRPFTRDAATDARLLLDAVRAGSVFTVIDAIATPASLDFRATLGNSTVIMGGRLPGGQGPARFVVRATVPPGATTILKRNGSVVLETSGGAFEREEMTPGVYRVEIEVPGAPGTPPVPWLVSNPIYWPSADAVNASSSSPDQLRLKLPLTQASWHVESDPGSTGSITSDGTSVTLSYRLKDLPRASQFVAFAVDLHEVPPDVNTIALRGRAAEPMRMSAQLRFGQDREQRWTRSVYLDSTERDARISLTKLRHAAESRTAPPPARPPVSRATSLLFVVDLTNGVPGAQGNLTLRDVGLGVQ
jgi:hypothetical protein